MKLAPRAKSKIARARKDIRGLRALKASNHYTSGGLYDDAIAKVGRYIELLQQGETVEEAERKSGVEI